MKCLTIPQTNLSVSQICLGTGEMGAPRIPRAAAFDLLDEFVALGGNFIDTAHVYSNWIPGEKSRSEKTIGAWFNERGNRKQIVLATKGAHPDLSTMHISRLSPADMAHDINESLEFLQTDSIDLYWLHRDDTAIPVSDILEPLNEQVAAGKIRYFGCSNWTVSRIQAAVDYAASKNIQGFVANQPMWSLAAPNMDRISDKTLVAMDPDTLAFHRRTGMTAIPYSSQAQGFFTKLAASGRAGLSESTSRYYTDTNVKRLEYAQMLARRYGVNLNDVVLAYLLCQPSTTIPVVGCKTLDQLRSSLKAADLTLTPEDVQLLESA